MKLFPYVNWKVISIVLLLLLTSAFTNHGLERRQYSIPTSQLTTSLSKHLNLGYHRLAATLLWFKANAYYGSHYKKNSYAFLAELFQQIVSLNPKFEPVYYMAASIFPWNTNSTQLSKSFTQQAMIEFPNDWRWPYYRGFNAYWFDHDYKQAAHYFELSSDKPNAPALVSSLAARMHAQTGSIDTAIHFLARLLQNKNDTATHAALLQQYKQLQTEKQLQQIESWLKTLPNHQRSLQDIQKLKRLGYPIPEKLIDGGNIIFINNQPVSSKSKKRFKLFIPPKRQGVIQHESTH